MKRHNILLLCMITTFLFLVVYIYCNYCKNPSISNIITRDDCKYIILVGMIIMNIFTILYEIERKDDSSLVIIIFLLIGIYGVIFIKEENNIHYVFAAIVFLAIISFMIKHFICNKKKTDILFILVFLQSILFIITLSNLDNNIFFLEVFYIITFAVFYIVLHFTNNKSKKNKNKN
jgi:hypothetical protein